MNALGEIEIHIEGKVGAQRLTPALVDIEEIRVLGRQNLKTFEMDPNSLKFVELLDQDRAYSQSYLDALLQNAAPAWDGVTDPDAWLEELRGGVHA